MNVKISGKTEKIVRKASRTLKCNDYNKVVKFMIVFANRTLSQEKMANIDVTAIVDSLKEAGIISRKVRNVPITCPLTKNEPTE